MKEAQYIFVLSFVVGCMTQPSVPPPLPVTSRSGSPTGGRDGNPDGSGDANGGLDPNTFRTGQTLVGNWDGQSDEILPDSKWQLGVQGNQQSNAWQNEIAISLSHPVDVKNDSYQFLLAAPKTSTGLELCEGDCNAPGVRTFPAQYVFFNATKKFYWMATPALLDDGLRLEFRYLGANRQVAGQRQVEFLRKGSTRKPTTPTTLPQTNPNPPGISLIEAKGLITQYCGGSGCHSDYASNPASTPKSSSLSRIQSGNMPRGRTLVGQDRERLIAWLRQP